MKKIYDLEEKVYEHMTSATIETVYHGVKDIYVDDGLQGVGIELAKLVTEVFDFCIAEGIDLSKCLQLLRDWEKAQEDKKEKIGEQKCEK